MKKAKIIVDVLMVIVFIMLMCNQITRSICTRNIRSECICIICNTSNIK